MKAYSEDTPNALVDQFGQEHLPTGVVTGELTGELYTDRETGEPRYVQPADRPLTQIPRLQQREKES